MGTAGPPPKSRSVGGLGEGLRGGRARSSRGAADLIWAGAEGRHGKVVMEMDGKNKVPEDVAEFGLPRGHRDAPRGTGMF